MFTTIVLGLDGSAESDKALALVRDLAAQEQARVEAVHVRELMLAGRGGQQLVHADEKEIEAAVAEQVRTLTDAGIDAHLTVVSTMAGGPAHALAEHAKTSGADLIVVGTRGRSSITGLLLGSVTQRLLHIAPCPVLAVPGRTASAVAEQAQQTETADV